MSYTNINGVLVDNRIFTVKFSCDYEKCKGACCYQPIEGECLLGGAISDYDAALIQYHKDRISSLCDPDCQAFLFYKKPVIKVGDLFFTSLLKSQCVFCSMDKGTCVLKLCRQIDKDLDIPLSCQLYPILWQIVEHDGHSVDKLTIGDVFDKFCQFAYEKGERENTYLLDFCKDSIIRAFGEKFWNILKEEQKNFI